MANLTARKLSREQQRLQSYGPWAVVTGASSGIGREMAILLAEAGVHLVLVGRNLTVLDSLVGLVQQKHQVQTVVVEADLSQRPALELVYQAAQDLEIGLLICSAGFGSSGPFLEASLEHELEMLEVNCRASMELSLHFGRRFRERKKGGIVLLSSIVAFQGVPGSAHYSATKAYIQNLAEALHIELAPFGVDVLASAPGPVHTSFAQRASMKMGQALQPETVALSTLAALGRQSVVRPGWLSKALAFALWTLPRWGRVRVMGLVMKGMSAR
jgi:uncharacterized protein